MTTESKSRKKATKPEGEQKNPVGRPTLYKPEYAQQVYELALLGLTDVEMARVFNVDERTLNNWKQNHPEFFQSMLDGKDSADAKVAAKLFQRAIGYEHRAVKIVADAKTGADHQVQYTERYPPDTTAAIFWLKNRQKAKWRDKTEQEVQQNVVMKADVAGLDPAEAYMRMIGKK